MRVPCPDLQPDRCRKAPGVGGSELLEALSPPQCVDSPKDVCVWSVRSRDQPLQKILPAFARRFRAFPVVKAVAIRPSEDRKNDGYLPPASRSAQLTLRRVYVTAIRCTCGLAASSGDQLPNG